jgi:uncharacterized protein YgfB (UPF0149 family)
LIGGALQRPDYDEIEDALSRVGGVHSPAEVHGILCGLLTKDAAVDETFFIGLILGEASSDDALVIQARQQLSALQAFTRGQLQDSELGLELLMPNDDDSLDDRIAAACDWAKGFVYGLAVQGVESARQLPEDSAEFLSDCKILSNGEYEAAEGEEGEVIYMELLEYLRMGALVLQEELQPLRQAPRLH